MNSTRELNNKIKAFDAVVGVKRKKIAQLAIKFNEVQREIEAIKILQEEVSKSYFHNLESVNLAREGQAPGVIGVYEQGLDSIKQKWLVYQERRHNLNRWSVQVRQAIQGLEKELHSLEMVRNKYEKAMHVQLEQREQKSLDDYNSSLFNRNRRGGL